MPWSPCTKSPWWRCGKGSARKKHLTIVGAALSPDVDMPVGADVPVENYRPGTLKKWVFAGRSYIS